jgi:hypothetical protein
MGSTVQQVPGIKRTDLQRHDLSVPGREVIQDRVDIGADIDPILDLIVRSAPISTERNV